MGRVTVGVRVTSSIERVWVGSLADLRSSGQLVAKVGAHGVLVVWQDGRAHAIDDRCPHMGFPLHRGTVEEGLVTCHWHHARFDVVSGCTLDPFADDARSYPVEIDGDDVYVIDRSVTADGDHLRRRLTDGLEQGLTLVTAKAVLGLLDAGNEADRADQADRADAPTGIVRLGAEFGTAYRREGWGAGLTVLTAMANLLPHLAPSDRALALVHGLAFVSRDTAGHAPRFGLEPLAGDVDGERLVAWFRRFVDTRSADAAERTLLTAIDGGSPPAVVARMLVAACTDHVFIDGGHTIDFTNKALELLDHLGWDRAGEVLPTLVVQMTNARRQEELGSWRHPHDLAGLVERANDRLSGAWAEGERRRGSLGDPDVAALGWRLLDDDPDSSVEALLDAVADGADAEQLGRAVAFAAALRITRFHVQNDHRDWDVVHHGFTAANAVHQLLARYPNVESLRAVVHGALKVFLDRFLNVPAARIPDGDHGDHGEFADLADLQACWDAQGEVDRAGAIVVGHLRSGGRREDVVAELGRALLAEDAEFHWFQTVEAAIRQAYTWPDGSEESALVLAGAARFLAAHTPNRRELAQVVRTAVRLRRGEELFTESPDPC
jgi:nitrite reductase/ring-hydroxylating ferredoxin subunit